MEVAKSEIRTSRRPIDSDFMQQRLRSWNPIFTAGNVFPFIFTIGTVLIPIGIAILYFSNNISMHAIDYTHCKPIMNDSLVTNITCADTVLKNPNTLEPCTCSIAFSLNENFNGKVFMYYKLTNYYQNHRRYVESRDDCQLIGTFTSNKCKLLKEDKGKAIIPCGAIANSLFNDTFTLFSKPHGEVPVYNTGIAWLSDKKRKFKNPANLKDALKNKAKPIAWRKHLWELDPNNPDNNGLQNEDLIVWMRTEALPMFSKLYRRVNHDSQAVFKDGLPSGEYELRIVYNYPVTQFQGTKSFILSTTSILGGKNTFLGWTYIIVGCIYFLFGIVLLIIHRKHRRTQTEIDKVQKNMDTSTTVDSTTFILDLNDDCLDKVFSYSSYLDILSASQVCIRLEDRCRNIFKRRNYTLDIFCEEAIGSILLRRLGPSLSKLRLFFCDDVAQNQEKIDIVTEICIGNLKEIRLHGLTNRNKLRKSFKRVEKLTLSFCDSIGDFKLTKWFPNLTFVHYHYTENLKKFIKQSIPTIHSLSISGSIEHKETMTMLLANPQIKNLSLNFVDRGGTVLFKRSLFTAINETLPELQTFNVSVHGAYDYEIPYQPLHFKHLKSLKIENYSCYPNFGLINQLAISPISLERLQLRFSHVTGDPRGYNSIIKYKNLRELQLMPAQHALKVDQIIMLIAELPLLERIEQLVDFTNDMPWTNQEIKNFLSNSKQLKELVLVFIKDKFKFERQLLFYETQFGYDWKVTSEHRQATKIFNADGLDGQMEKNFVIRLTKDVST